VARILVADDVPFIAAMIGSVFEREGHEVSIAADGAEAVRKARDLLPDLILLDLVMPGTDGLEAARRIKSDSSTHHIPIMMISAMGDLRTISDAFAADVAEFVTKPFETDELLEKASMLLGSFRMTYSISDEKRIPTVTVLHDELALETFDLLLHALRTAQGSGARPIVLDLSRVRRLAAETEAEIGAFAAKIRDLGEDLHIVRPEAGTRASQILPGVARELSLHDSKSGAVSAARRTARAQGFLSEVMTPLPSAPVRRPPAGGDAIRFEVLDTLAMVRLPGPEIRGAELVAIGEGIPPSAHVLLLDLSEIRELSAARLRELGDLVDRISLTGRRVKLVNPCPAVADALREGGQAANLFTLKGRSRGFRPAAGDPPPGPR
jgi:CheY-like chemotaxis protein